MLKFFINIMICRNSAEFSLSRKIHSYCQRCNRTWSPLWLHWWYWSQSGPPSRAWLGLRASGSLGQTLRDWGSLAGSGSTVLVPWLRCRSYATGAAGVSVSSSRLVHVEARNGPSAASDHQQRRALRVAICFESPDVRVTDLLGTIILARDRFKNWKPMQICLGRRLRWLYNVLCSSRAEEEQNSKDLI